MSRLRVAAAILTLLPIAACQGGPDIDDPLTWDDVTAPGYLDDKAAAVYFSPYEDKAEDGDGVIAFVGLDGSVELLQVENGTPGLIRALSPDDLVWAGDEETVRVRGTESSRTEHPRTYSGDWIGTTAAGEPLVVQGSSTDDGRVRWGVGARSLEAEFSGLFRSGGVVDELFWSVVSKDFATEVHATDLASGTTSRRAILPGVGIDGRDHQPSSDVVGHAGRIWFLDQAFPAAEDGGPSVLQLVEVDPASGAVRETELEPLSAQDDDDFFVTSGSTGALVDGSLVQLLDDGRIVAVDLDEPALRVVATISDAAMEGWARAAWHDDSFTILTRTGDDLDVHALETYSVRDGSLTGRLAIDDLDVEDLLPDGLAVLRPS